MTENKIELKSINELLGMSFFIPSYQRGYRWTTQQVKDLLNDIQEFIDKKQKGGFYCVQPLVVNAREQDQRTQSDKTKSWEVIDGQQRLTTIYILLSRLNVENKYLIEYETREDSRIFLQKIDETKKEDNIDYFHIVAAKNQIDEWFQGKDDVITKKFCTTLLDNVKFIWYAVDKNENPIKVFTRLNIGKISLTNAELIKALFLNKSNFEGDGYQKIRLQQQEIASEWDTIEYTLQNDEFWLFLNKPDYDKPTRIDFIFDLMCEKDILKLKKEDLGTDEYKTFRYFYFWFKQQNESKTTITDCWKKIKTLFQTFQEWFNDLELYHYIGFLIDQNIPISDIFDNWEKDNQSKEKFKNDYLVPQIKTKIHNIKLSEVDGLTKEHGLNPILLLHNIQTIINQNRYLKDDEKYKLPVFYKFPFHLFKKEKWDVEHIDSNTENALEAEKDQKEWLKAASIGIKLNDKLKDDIKKFITAKKDGEKPEFSQLYDKVIEDYRKSGSGEEKKLSDEEKNKIWNLCLLDASTNRGYGNSIFPAKRRAIIGKDQGKKIAVNDELEVDEDEGTIAFIPPCTKNVFLKYYNPSTNSLREWDKDDAEAYLKNIKEVLKSFFN
ncbi:MAG: DUF262 domain-containing protein [Prevotellaceae bacterium]|jgi:hypothetical protein|nr:DUF262 domain-containing protein [Prevotellaceae bacterium]